MNICFDTTLRELYAEPSFAAMRGNFISSVADQWILSSLDCSLRQLQEQHPTWSAEDMQYGLRRLQIAADSGHTYVFPAYSEEEILASPDKAQVQLIALPSEEQTDKPFALLLSGGAYGAVCTLAESLPVAARLNELGVSCFCLNYRTASPESVLSGLMPKPLEDIAAALRFLGANRKRFALDPDQYLVGGFSAGGHAAALWGTKLLGARAWGLNQPELLLLAYPMISTLHFQPGPVKAFLQKGLFGADFTQDTEERYAVHLHVDAQYPPVYLVYAKDDDTIPVKDPSDMERALDTAAVPHRIECGAFGGHGFGLGSSTALNGWVDRAFLFWEKRNGTR